MGTADPTQAVASVTNALKESLGDGLLGLFLYESFVTGHYRPDISKINLLAVLAGDATLHAARNAFLPVWQRYGRVLRCAPVVVPQDQLARYLRLHPAMTRHLFEHGRQLAGAVDLLPSPDPDAVPDPRETLASLVQEVMQLSALLVPELLGIERQSDLQARLTKFWRQCFHGEPTFGSIAEQIIALQEMLTPQVAAAGVAGVHPPPEAEAPSLLPDLQAIYEYQKEALLVLPDPLAGQIRRTDWQTVGQLLEGEYRCVMVVSPDQLRLIASFATPVEAAIGLYQLIWGSDLLADLDLPRERVLTASARRASELRASALPGAYLTCVPSREGDVIHHFQNKLLNIQLQHELLAHRLQLVSPRPPALPHRSALLAERIDGIVAQLDWWVDYDLSLITGAANEGC